MSAALVAGYSRDTWARAFPAAARARPVLRVVPALVQHDAGVIERRNPLPVGVYWKDIFPPDFRAMDRWFNANKATVKIRTTQHFASVGSDPDRDWVLFEVTAPTHWDGPGYPDIAGPNVHTSADTVQAPPPEKNILDQLDAKDPLGLKTVAGNILLVGAAAVAAVLIFKN